MVQMLIPVTAVAPNESESLYECPPRAAVDVGTVTSVTASAQVDNVQTQVVSLIVTNTSGTVAWFSLYKNSDIDNAADPATDDANCVMFQIDVAAQEVRIFSPGLLMSGGDVLWIVGETDDALTATLNYIEIS